MDLIGERWSMPLIRELLFGPRRFSDLKTSLNGISANVLTQRLEGLEAAGVLLKRRLPSPASVQVYELTAWGYEAAPIFAALGRWAVRSPKHDATRPFSPVSLMLSFRTMLNEAVAGDFAARVALRIGGEDLHWVREDGQVTVGRGEIERPDLRFVAASASDIAAAVYGDAPFESVLAEGDLRLARRFRSLFTLPPKVEAAAALS